MSNTKIYYWKNKEGKLNYHIRSYNGKILAGSNQGHDNMQGLKKNIAAVSDLFLDGKESIDIELHFVASPRSKTIIKTITITV